LGRAKACNVTTRASQLGADPGAYGATIAKLASGSSREDRDEEVLLAVEQDGLVTAPSISR
jgi:hypothetical protein